jgi:hypothetical protein
MKRILLFLLMLLASLAAATQIQDTGYTGINGTLFSGRLTITSPNMTAADGTTLYRAVQSFTITNGVISVNLEPNDTATPAGTSYNVVYRSTTGTSWSERWVVPTSASPLTVSQVRVLTPPAPSVMIQPSQILGTGAAVGQCLAWTGSAWAPATCGAVSTVFGRSGAVTAQTGDYSFSQITGSVGDSQISPGVDASKIGNGTVDNLAFGYLAGVTSPIQQQLTARPSGSGATDALPVWSGAQTLTGSSFVTVDEATKKVKVKPAGSFWFEDAGGAPVARIEWGGQTWSLNGFDLWNVTTLSLNSYMQALGYRVVSDFNATTISSASHNFGKLFDGGGNGYRKFKLTTNVTSPVFDFSVTQPSYITVLEICQDATGGRTITFPSNVVFGPLNATANKCTVQMMISRTMSSSPWIGAFPLAAAVSF